MDTSKERFGSVEASTTSQRKRMEALQRRGRIGLKVALLLAQLGDASLLSGMLVLSDIAVQQGEIRSRRLPRQAYGKHCGTMRNGELRSSDTKATVQADPPRPRVGGFGGKGGYHMNQVVCSPLQKIREERGLTKKELAELLHTRSYVITKIEGGNMRIPAHFTNP